jgi:putative folate metabolism gamma-glutamate ligase
MHVKVIKTRLISPNELSLKDLLDESIESLEENSVVVITSKVVALCEGSVEPIEGIDRESLIIRESDLYLPKENSKYGHHFSIKYNTLIASAGIDESNGDGYYVLWPRSPWDTANNIRQYLKDKFDVKNIGIIISDSTSQILRQGTIGISIAHSGFAPLHSYINEPDLFGRTIQHIRANIANGLAAAGVVAMGEGAEQTPIAVLTDIPFVEFEDSEPTVEEITELNIALEDDLFAPFLQAVEWKKGKD